MNFERKPVLSFGPEDLEAICRVASPREYAAGETIFLRGDDDHRMLYVERGEVELDFGEGTERKTVHAGHFFGELAFIIRYVTRTASARAKTDCTLFCLDESAYEVLMRESPYVCCTLLRNTCEYLLDSEQSLIASLGRKSRELENTLHYLKKTREELDYKEFMAHSDELTGLFNRRGLNLFLEKFIEHAKAAQEPLGLLMLDLDNFKQVNDTLGHHKGDEVLQKVADILRGCTRNTDVACRRGGDEFVVLLPGISKERGLDVAEAIRRRIEEGCAAAGAGLEINVTGSLGLAFFGPEDSAGDLLLRADRNLYQAKGRGRNQVACAHG